MGWRRNPWTVIAAAAVTLPLVVFACGRSAGSTAPGTVSPTKELVATTPPGTTADSLGGTG